MIMLKKAAKDSSGFSFMELMVVIAMTGILSAIALPGILRALPEQRVKNAARNLYADMQRVRLLAVKENKKMYVRFSGSDTADAADDFYYCVNDTNKGPEDAVFRRNLSEDGDVSFGKGKAVKDWNKKTINNITWNVSFNATGTAGAGRALLQNQNKDVCYAITASPYGAVKIRRFNGTKWDED
jgi:type IV fimbrial biogenesis protein FimT